MKAHSSCVANTPTVYAYRGKWTPAGSATNGELGSAPEGDTRCHAGIARAFLPFGDGLWTGRYMKSVDFREFVKEPLRAHDSSGGNIRAHPLLT
jgi:hypothetical protein